MASLIITTHGTQVRTRLSDEKVDELEQKTQETAQRVIGTFTKNTVPVRAGNLTIMIPSDCPLGAAALHADSPTPGSASDSATDLPIDLFEEWDLVKAMKNEGIEPFTAEEQAAIDNADERYLSETLKKNAVAADIALQRKDVKLFAHAFAHMSDDKARELKSFLQECLEIADNYVD